MIEERKGKRKRDNQEQSEGIGEDQEKEINEKPCKVIKENSEGYCNRREHNGNSVL